MFDFLFPPIALNRLFMTSPVALHASAFNYPSPSLQGVHMHLHQIHQARWSSGVTLAYLPLIVIQIPTSRCAFRVGYPQHLSNGLKVDECTEIPSTSLFYLLGRICSSISQAMGKADLDLCFIFLPLVCCLCSIKLLQSSVFRPNSVRATLRNLCTRMVKCCQQIEKLHPHLQGTKPHFWMLMAI